MTWKCLMFAALVTTATAAQAQTPDIDTPLLDKAQPERVAELMKKIYTGRKGKPGEVAEAIRWLAVDAPPIINGAVIDITDGCFLR